MDYGMLRDEFKEINNWLENERQNVVNGKEIEPPWRHCGENETLADLPWAKGNCPKDWWEEKVWWFFWKRLQDEQKRKYIEKWQPPVDWYQTLVYKSLSSTEEIDWLNNQMAKVKNGEEIEPPWVTFPIGISSFGWDEEATEGWKLEVWIPFWDGLNEKEQKAYLKKWQPPNKEWEENITKHWVGKIRKTEQWYERQKTTSEYGYKYYGRIYDKYVTQMPWEAFPPIRSKQTQWDDDGKERWLKEIWLPFWNGMSEEEQESYLRPYHPALPPTDYWFQMLAKYKVKNLHKLKELKPHDFELNKQRLKQRIKEYHDFELNKQSIKQRIKEYYGRICRSIW